MSSQEGTVVSINISQRKGVSKKPVKEVFVSQTGIAGDAHAGDWHRQVSFLAQESIAKMQKKGLKVVSGSFAENITTLGIKLDSLKTGNRLRIGQCLLEVSQIGKVCPRPCAIYYQAGDCVMPKEGIFAKVLKEGAVRVGDKIRKVRSKECSGDL